MRPGDVASLAQLAFDAFRGSADGDWSLEQYVHDMEATLAGRFGAFLADASALVATPTRTLGAVLFTKEHGLPFLPHCLTDPLAQRQGLATHLITRARAHPAARRPPAAAARGARDEPRRRALRAPGFPQAAGAMT